MRRSSLVWFVPTALCMIVLAASGRTVTYTHSSSAGPELPWETIVRALHEAFAPNTAEAESTVPQVGAGNRAFERAATIDPGYAWHAFYPAGRAIAVEPAGGCIFVAGYCTASWNGPDGQPPLNAYGGNLSFFVLKLDTNGAYLWHTFHGSSHREGPDLGIALDGSGNVYVTGSSDATWKGPAGQLPLHTFKEGEDLFVLKLDRNGSYKWHTFHGSTSIGDLARSVAVDKSGNVYVTGESYVTWDGPDGQPPLHPYSGTYSGDGFILKLGTDGNYQWHTFYGTADKDDDCFGIALDGSSNVYVTGTSNQTWKGPGGKDPLNPHTGWYDIFVLKLDTGGAYRWHTFHGAPSTSTHGVDWAEGIAVDGDGAVTVTARSDVTWNGPGGTAPLHALNPDHDDIAVLKLGSDGSYRWHTFHGNVDADYTSGIAAGPTGTVYVTGQSQKAWTGPSGELPIYPFSSWVWDIFVLALDAGGAYQWHAFYGSMNDEEGKSVESDDNGNIYVAGSGGGWNGPEGEPPLRTGGSGFVLKMASNMPVVLTASITGITTTEADTGGDVVSDGGLPVTARGVCWSTPPYPTVADPCTSNGTGTGQFSGAITGLVQNMTYHVRAYAANAAGTAYGDDQEFTTPAVPSRGNLTINKLGTGSGKVTGTDGLDCADFPCVKSYETGTEVTIAAKALNGSVFAGWSGGTGSAASCAGKKPCGFTITEDSSATATFSALPKVTTKPVSNVKTTTATGGGTVTYGGGIAVTGRGICWSKAPKPGKGDECTKEGSGTGPFTSSIEGLTPDTTYHARAYASNPAGTAFGKDVEFTTSPLSPPTVATSSITGITSISAMGGGTVKWDGGKPVTRKGVCWSTSPAPDRGDSCTNDGTGTEKYSSFLTGLKPSTVYYVRAYASNSTGTGYGPERHFKTAAAAPLAYITNSADDTVSVIDTRTNTVAGPPIPVGDFPMGVAVSPAGTRVYVANRTAGTVSVINTATNRVVGSPVPVGAVPLGIAASPAGTYVYVVNNQGDSVSVIDTKTNTVVGSPIPVGKAPFGIAVHPEGTRVYVVNNTASAESPGTVSVIDTATNTVIGQPIPVGKAPCGIAVNPAGTRAYVTNYYDGTVSVINTATNSVIGQPIPVGKAQALAVNPAGTRVYVAVTGSNTVSVIDATSNKVTGSPIAVGNGPSGISVSPSGTRVYVANMGSKSVSVINTATNAVVDTITVGNGPMAYGLFIGPTP